MARLPVSPDVSSPFAYGLQLASLTKHVPVDYSHTLLAERVHLVSTRRCLKEGGIFSSGQKTKVTEHADPARRTRRWDAMRGVPKTPLCILLVPRSSFHRLSSPLAAQTSITQMMSVEIGQVFGPATPPSVLKGQEDAARPLRDGYTPHHI